MEIYLPKCSKCGNEKLVQTVKIKESNLQIVRFTCKKCGYSVKFESFK